MGANDPLDMANLDPRGMVGRIYVGNHYAVLQTKYRSCEPHGFRKEDFLKGFPHCKFMEANEPPVHAQFALKGHG